MSVNWSWKDKMGEIDLVQKSHEDGTERHFTLNLYKANCICAILYEYKNEKGKDMYQFEGFFNDIHHLKRCIGLEASYEYNYELKKRVKVVENLYNKEDSYWNLIKLNIAYPYMLKMGELLAKAGFRVELYYKEVEKDDKV